MLLLHFTELETSTTLKYLQKRKVIHSQSNTQTNFLYHIAITNIDLLLLFIAQNAYYFPDIYLQCRENYRTVKYFNPPKQGNLIGQEGSALFPAGNTLRSLTLMVER